MNPNLCAEALILVNVLLRSHKRTGGGLRHPLVVCIFVNTTLCIYVCFQFSSTNARALLYILNNKRLTNYVDVDSCFASPLHSYMTYSFSATLSTFLVVRYEEGRNIARVTTEGFLDVSEFNLLDTKRFVVCFREKMGNDSYNWTGKIAQRFIQWRF